MISQFITWFQSQIQTNNIFGGVLAAGGITSILMAIRQWGSKLLRNIYDLFFIKITIKNNTDSFANMETWISNNPYIKSIRCRKLRLIDSTYDVSDDGLKQSVFTIGDATHTIFFKKRLFRIARSTKEKGGREGGEIEYYDIHCLSFSKKPIYALLSAIDSAKDSKPFIQLYQWNVDWWNKFTTRTFRNKNTIFTNTDIFETLAKDLTWFKDNGKWYMERGIPYRRGYLFSGPPGTGKTSLISVLASEYKMNVCLIDINNCQSDTALLKAFSAVPTNSIILIEDIDAVKTKKMHSRSAKSEPKEETNGISLSGLLNALDGVSYREGTVVIMTTNHPEDLDPAVLRPGRVNLHVKFELANKDCAVRMLTAFYGELSESYIKSFKKCLPKEIQQARLQELFIIFKEFPEKLLTALEEKDSVVKSILGE
jgi:chaperone BCS1